jgi:UTP:GlnB (protein PII) uridylyltransferase
MRYRVTSQVLCHRGIAISAADAFLPRDHVPTPSMQRFAKALTQAENRLESAGTPDFEARVAEYMRLLTLESKWLEQQRKKRSGLDLGAMRSDVIDHWLRHLLTVGMSNLQATGRKPFSIALVAIGGYGRRELNPLSDIDFTILHKGGLRLADGLEDLVKEFLHIILACGYTPGHSTRNLDETIAEANKEMQS